MTPGKNKKQILIGFLIFALLWSALPSDFARGAITESFPLTVTITTPNSQTPVGVNPQIDPILLPEEDFALHGIAQPNKMVNLYGWALLPGTDGNLNPDEVITEFSGEVTSGTTITLSWHPRTVFTQGYLESRLGGVGTTCEMLKTHCRPEDGETVGTESTNCSAGNVPPGLNCTLPPEYKNYLVYDQIVKPGKVSDVEGILSLEIVPPLAEANLAQTINSTRLLDQRCQNNGCGGCEYDFFPVGWQYLQGPLERNASSGTIPPKPLLTPDLGEFSYNSLNVDEVNGFVPSLNGPGNAWDSHIIPPYRYTPNITTNSYSGLYVFSYANFVRGYNEDVFCDGDPAINTEYSVSGFFPIKDMTVLVDAFDQYEIYAVAAEDYEAQTGVTPENGTLVKVLRDPSISEAQIDYLQRGLDPARKYYFALFEKRASGQVRLPRSLTEPITAKEVDAADCIGDPEAPPTCHAVTGHSITTPDEVAVPALSSAIFANEPVTISPSPQKIEWEIHEQRGSYTADPIVSDRNGELKSGSDGSTDIRISRSRLNRFASQHLISGIYYSDDTRLSSGNDRSFFIASNRKAATAFGLPTIPGGVIHFRHTEDPYGVVFNAYTGEIIGHVSVELTANSEGYQERFRSVQETASDGLFSFSASPGSYFLNILEVAGRDDNFLFPSDAYSPVGTSDRNGNGIPEDCGDDPDGIFTEIYCQPRNLEIPVGTGIQHRDIPIDPPLRGIVNSPESVQILLSKNDTVIATTWSTPESGKFSFFVSPGEYDVSILREHNGGLQIPSEGVTIPATADGKPADAIDMNFTL